MAKIDVVIPVYKPDDKFSRLVEMLCRQTERPGKIQLMVTRADRVDAKSVLWRAESIRNRIPEAKQVELAAAELEKKDFDHGDTRNQGIALCKAPFVLCMTQDAVPRDEELLTHMLAAMEASEENTAVYARQMAGLEADFLIRLTQAYNYADKPIRKTKESYETLGIKSIFCSDVCCLYRKAVFEKLGGFQKDLIFNEDMIYARTELDAGYAIIYAPAAKVEHWHQYTMLQQFRRNFDLAVSQKQHPEVFADLSSEAEGKKYVKAIVNYLLKEGMVKLACRFVVQSGMKFLGYRLGKCYEKLPNALIRKCAMNPDYFTEERLEQLKKKPEEEETSADE